MFIILIIRICNIECNVIEKVLVTCEKCDEKYRCKRIVPKLFLDSFIHMRFFYFYFILRGIFIKKNSDNIIQNVKICFQKKSISIFFNII